MSVKTLQEIDEWLEPWPGEIKALYQCYEWVKTDKLNRQGFLYMITTIRRIVNKLNADLVNN